MSAREQCACGHLREAHAEGVGSCIDWQADLRNCECTRFVEYRQHAALYTTLYRRLLYAADCASRRDAHARRMLNVFALSPRERIVLERRLDGRPTLSGTDAELVRAVAATAHGWAFVAVLAMQWTLTAAALLVAGAGCSSSHYELDAGDVAELGDAGELDAGELDAGELDAGELDAGDVAELEAACRRAAIAYEAADYRLGCHRVSSCCTITHACPVDVDVDACVRARESSSTCAELEAPVCAFAPTFPEAP